MNKSKKILEFRDKLELVEYLINRCPTKRIDESITRNILNQTHRIPIIGNLPETLRREVKELTYE